MSEPKLSITPCIFSRKVYLCGRVAIDVFNLSSHRFEPKLPITFQEEDYIDRVSVIVQNELIVISRRHTIRINLSAEAPLQEEQHDRITIIPNSSAVVVGEFIYWIRVDKCMRATLQQPTHFSEF